MAKLRLEGKDSLVVDESSNAATAFKRGAISPIPVCARFLSHAHVVPKVAQVSELFLKLMKLVWFKQPV